MELVIKKSACKRPEATMLVKSPKETLKKAMKCTVTENGAIIIPFPAYADPSREIGMIGAFV